MLSARRILPLACALALAPAAPPPRQELDRVAAWTEDVLRVVEELPRLHPDPWFSIPQEEFEAAVDELLGRLEELSDTEATIELMRLFALISRAGRDGHSVVWPVQAPLLPIRLYAFSDGWFVVDAAAGESALVGAEVVALGGLPVEEACARLAPLLTRDNEWNLRLKLGLALVVPEVLHGVGLAPDAERARVRLRIPGGDEREFELPASQPLAVERSFVLPARAGARRLEGREQAFRMEVLPGTRALYVQYNQIVPRDAAGRTLADFADELARTFTEEKLERVIVDVRSNGGGDNTTFGPLIRVLQEPPFDRPGAVYALIGRETFSAAGNFAAALERDTRATLVGEPTGGGPNQYGDARTVDLPHHPGLLVRISTRYHVFGAPDDPRLAVEPDLAVPLGSADYFAGRDPVLERALAHDGTR